MDNTCSIVGENAVFIIFAKSSFLFDIETQKKGLVHFVLKTIKCFSKQP